MPSARARPGERLGRRTRTAPPVTRDTRAVSAVHVVTGAAGHLGTAVVRALLDDGRTVLALVLPGQELLAASLVDDAARSRLSRRDADVTDGASLDATLADLAGEDLVVIHTAGLISIGHLPLDRLRAVNVGGTAAVLAASRAVGASSTSPPSTPSPSAPTSPRSSARSTTPTPTILARSAATTRAAWPRPPGASCARTASAASRPSSSSPPG